MKNVNISITNKSIKNKKYFNFWHIVGISLLYSCQ